jgi:tetratricopeptide (TPR) repeat protein
MRNWRVQENCENVQITLLLYRDRHLEDARKNYDAAAENYRKALEKDPNSLIAANNLAWLYATTGKGDLDEAIRLAQSVVQKNPNIAGFVDTLGWVYFQKKLYAAAVDSSKGCDFGRGCGADS